MSEGLRIFLGIIVFVGIIALYITSYMLNKKVKKPEGCIELNAECDTCATPLCTHLEGEDG